MRLNLREIKKDPATRSIASAWRRLRRGDPSALLAVSGGADSSALALALASFGLDEGCTIAHVRHTMRAEAETLKDAERVRELARALDLPYRMIEIDRATRVSEGAQRAARYDVLAGLADELGGLIVATGHHADDQLETVLLAMLRGAGARGMGGMRESRELAAGCELVRPMLGVTHNDACRLCSLAGWQWIEDPTNRNADRVRAALRQRVLPELRAMQGDASLRAARSAALVQVASNALDERVEGMLATGATGTEFVWARVELIALPEMFVSAVVRAAAIRVAEETLGDRFSFEESTKAARCVIDGPGGPRVFEWAFGVRVEIDHHSLRVRRAKTNEAPDGAEASEGCVVLPRSGQLRPKPAM